MSAAVRVCGTDRDAAAANAAGNRTPHHACPAPRSRRSHDMASWCVGLPGILRGWCGAPRSWQRRRGPDHVVPSHVRCAASAVSPSLRAPPEWRSWSPLWCPTQHLCLLDRGPWACAAAATHWSCGHRERQLTSRSAVRPCWLWMRQRWCT